MLVKLVSTALTGYFYTTSRIRTAPKLMMIKYDPVSEYRNTRGAQGLRWRWRGPSPLSWLLGLPLCELSRFPDPPDSALTFPVKKRVLFAETKIK